MMDIHARLQELLDSPAEDWDSLYTLAASLKEDLAGMVAVPDAEHMTEEMADATRPVHLHYSDCNGGISCRSMRKALDRYSPWLAEYYPGWFKTSEGHLTKEARAQLCYALTLGAHLNPGAKERWLEQARKEHAQLVASTPRRITAVAVAIDVKTIGVDPAVVTKVRTHINLPMSEVLYGEDYHLHSVRINHSDLPKDQRDKAIVPKTLGMLTFKASGDEGIDPESISLGGWSGIFDVKLLSVKPHSWLVVDRPLVRAQVQKEPG